MLNSPHLYNYFCNFCIFYLRELKLLSSEAVIVQFCKIYLKGSIIIYNGKRKCVTINTNLKSIGYMYHVTATRTFSNKTI